MVVVVVMVMMMVMMSIIMVVDGEWRSVGVWTPRFQSRSNLAQADAEERALEDQAASWLSTQVNKNARSSQIFI